MRNQWKRVVFASDCMEDDSGYLECPQCGDRYDFCDCPGPTQDDEYEYKNFGSILYARRKCVQTDRILNHA